MNLRQKIAHMRAAYVYADLSYCIRKKVGCVIVRDHRIISIGYNGTPAGHDNCCEGDDGLTKAEVIHAEDNAIRKLKEAGETGENTICFVTCCPCLPCAKTLVEFGIRRVIYDTIKKTGTGLQYMLDNGVHVEQLTVQ